MVRLRDEWRRPSVLGTRDSEIRGRGFPVWAWSIAAFAMIGVGVQRAANVLEGHAADLVCEQARPGMQRLQSGVLHFVVAEHLLNEQQRVGADQNLPATARFRPFQRGEEAAYPRRYWWPRQSIRENSSTRRRRLLRCARRNPPAPGCRAPPSM
jgi:hypothetical protein